MVRQAEVLTEKRQAEEASFLYKRPTTTLASHPPLIDQLLHSTVCRGATDAEQRRQKLNRRESITVLEGRGLDEALQEAVELIVKGDRCV